jgi:cytidylate kinase
MANTIITISRQFGSGGRTVGKKVADLLGLKCYDKEIITKISEQSGFAEDYIREEGEYVDNPGLFSSLGGLDYYGHSNRITIWTEQCRILKEIAEKGDAVIVGRCADYVLQDHANLIRIFIYADMDSRADRIVNEYGESDIKPEKRLREKDKRRAAYYEIYTDQKFGDPLNYDLCLNSASVGIDRCAEIIADLYKNPVKK